MPDIIPFQDPIIPPRDDGTAREFARMRQRLDAMEARLTARDATAPDLPRDAPREGVPPGVLAGRFLAAMSGVAATALVLIAGSLVWQMVHPAPQAGPTVVVNTPPPAAPGNALAGAPSGAPSGTQASAQMPVFHPPGLMLPQRPGLRGYYPRG